MTSTNTRVMRCSPDDVFAVLGDGWTYPSWVVGASRMRAVDPEWPEPGARLHHSLGIWPVLFDDHTEVVEWSAPRRLRLRPSAGPVGRGVIVIDVREHEQGCAVRMYEEPVSGAARVMPRLLWLPLLVERNRESLRRLAFLAEGRRREKVSEHDSARPEVPDTAEGRPSAQARADTSEAGEPAPATTGAVDG